MYLCHVRSHNFNFRASSLRLAGCGFDSWPGNTKDYENGIHCVPAWHSVFGLDLEGLDHPVIPRVRHRCCSPLPLGMSLMWRTNFTSLGTWQSVGLHLDFFFFFLPSVCMSVINLLLPREKYSTIWFRKGESVWRQMEMYDLTCDTVANHDNREPLQPHSAATWTIAWWPLTFKPVSSFQSAWSQHDLKYSKYIYLVFLWNPLLKFFTCGNRYVESRQ